MANGLYVAYKRTLLGTTTHSFADLDSNTIRIMGVDHADVTPSLTTHEDEADLTAGKIFETAAIASVTTTDGIFDHAAVIAASVTGDQFESVHYFKDSGTASTSPLIAMFDTATGLPFTPSGGAITITPHATGVFGF